ncbi:MAG: glucose 1-dehydrogenase [Gammaproteobacteria bacterium]|nr:glucose 1-dehydrogenase [Gammaproteobacteria bacterium]
MTVEADTLADNYFELSGTVALVTGASSGLGWHFAQTLARAGAHVGLAARRTEKLESLHDLISSFGGSSTVLPMDVTDRAAVDEGLDLLAKQYGPVELLINNAGIADENRFIDAEDATTDSVFAVNQTAVWQVGQSVTHHMVEHKVAGVILNIASIAGIRTMSGAASYSVSKAAVVQLTKVMAVELARHNIRVNALAPGYMQTAINERFLESEAGKKLLRRIPMRRCGELTDLDGPFLLLVSKKSAFITGAVLQVDGGHSVSAL